MSCPRSILRLQDFEMVLEVVETKALRLHEEIIPELLARLTQDIEKEDVIHHPIIVDKNSLVVLDGTHRVEAFNSMGLSCVPACLVDYMDPRIKVGCWYRTVEKGDSNTPPRDLFEKSGGLKLEKASAYNAVKSSNAIALVSRDIAAISEQYRDLREVYQALKQLETQLRNSGYTIGYTTEEMAEQKLQDGSILAYVAMPALTKTVIIETALSGKRFPCKTSRHVIPARPMGVDFPVCKLRGRSLEAVNQCFYFWVSKKKAHQFPPGKDFEGRRYEESLFVLE